MRKFFIAAVLWLLAASEANAQSYYPPLAGGMASSASSIAIGTAAAPNTFNVYGGTTKLFEAVNTTLTTAVSQGAAGFWIPFSATNTISIGQIVTGTNVPANTIAQYIGNLSAPVTTTASGGGTANNTVTVASATGLTSFPLYMTDTTTAAHIGSQCVALQIVGSVITSNCSMASVANSDGLKFWPTVQLSQPSTGTVANGASIGFQNNTTDLTATNLSVQGNINFGGQLQYGGTNAFGISIGTTNVDPNIGNTYFSSVNAGIGALTSTKQEGANTAIGAYALNALSITNGFYEHNGFTIIGSGFFNTAVGYAAMAANSGVGCTLPAFAYNTAIGVRSMLNITCGIQNTAVGENSGGSLTTGNTNTIIGVDTDGVTTGSANTLIGFNIGGYNGQMTSASNITAVGTQVASTTLATGTNDLLLGTSSSTDATSGSESNAIHIGAGGADIIFVTGTNTNTTSIPTIHGTVDLPDLASSASALDATCWNATAGRLTHNGAGALCSASLRKFKDIIADVESDKALDIVMKLKPVWAKYKDSVTGVSQHPVLPMLIAEDVEKDDKRLATYDDKGNLSGVSYQYLPVVNSSAIQELQKIIQDQQHEIDELRAQIGLRPYHCNAFCRVREFWENL